MFVDVDDFHQKLELLASSQQPPESPRRGSEPRLAVSEIDLLRKYPKGIRVVRMRYEAVKELNAEGFKRLTGVRPEVFGQMLGVLREAETEKKKAGRLSKFCLEDKLLLTLSYWREYRTQFHIAASYAVHESSANRIITQVEDVLIKSKAFSLPKRREVTATDWTVVLVDATETPIERPKKTAALLQREEETPHPEKPNLDRYTE